MSKIFEGVNGFVDESLKEAAHNEFEWNKQLRQQKEYEERIAKKLEAEAEQ